MAFCTSACCLRHLRLRCQHRCPFRQPQPVHLQDLLLHEVGASLLLDIVSEKTGYPSEMLELDMDMEADLGIDSIKRVEILGAMRTSILIYPK
jgi:hypothetical protein